MNQDVGTTNISLDRIYAVTGPRGKVSSGVGMGRLGYRQGLTAEQIYGMRYS